MPVMAKASGGNYIPAPAGVWPSICCDVVDLGMLKQEFAGQSKHLHKIRIVWQISESRADGKPFTASKMYTLSLHEKATLRKDLESWRGRAFTEVELEGFDVESVLACSCMLNLVEASKNGKKYVNVVGVMKLMKGIEAPKIRDYVRVVDRQPTQAESVPAMDHEGGPPDWDHGLTDDDVPF